jgi:hypothetical protein
VINEYALHNLFVRALFVRPSSEELKTHRAEFTIVSAPEFQADRSGTRSEAFIVVNFTLKNGADRRHKICRRDEEVDLRHNEFPAAAKTTSSP